MASLLLFSAHPLTGKTALCAGLARWAQSQGKKVGYLKVGGGEGNGVPADGDVAFLAELLGQSGTAVAVAAPSDGGGHPEAPAALVERAEAAHGKLAQGSDLVLVEVASELTQSDGGTLVREQATRLGAASMLVVRYVQALGPERVEALASLGPEGSAIVLNGVPEALRERVERELVRPLRQRGRKVLGLLPYLRGLLSVPFGQLLSALGGRMILGEVDEGRLVEMVMIGTMCLDPSYNYLSLYPNKAVLVDGDRWDIQTSTFGTPTICLILTGGKEAKPSLLARAADEGLPIASIPQGTIAAGQAVERLFSQARFQQRAKVAALEAILAPLDLAALERLLS